MQMRPWLRNVMADDAHADPRELRLMAAGFTIGAALWTVYAFGWGRGGSRGLVALAWLWAGIAWAGGARRRR